MQEREVVWLRSLLVGDGLSGNQWERRVGITLNMMYIWKTYACISFIDWSDASVKESAVHFVAKNSFSHFTCLISSWEFLCAQFHVENGQFRLCIVLGMNFFKRVSCIYFFSMNSCNKIVSWIFSLSCKIHQFPCVFLFSFLFFRSV